MLNYSARRPGPTVLLSNLPVLHRSETLYSWCAHVHALNGGVSALKTSKMLFGAPYAALAHDFPSHLDRLDRVTDGCLGPKRDVELRHTLLGYFLAIAGRTSAESVLTTVESGAAQHLKMLLGITASRVDGRHPLKACPQCIDEDERLEGWAYWHTTHQFPSSYVCERHGCSLIASSDSVTPVHRRTWKLPLSMSANEWQSLRIPECAIDSLLLLARNSSQMSQLRPGSLTQARLALTYRDALFRMGLSSKHGNLRIADIPSLVQQKHPELIKVPALARLTHGSMGWTGIFASISRRAYRPAHPLKHLVLITALFDSWKQFIDAYHTDSVSSLEADPNERPLPSSEAKKTRFERLVRHDRLSVSAASRAAGISTTTGTQWAKQMGIGYTSRAKLMNKDMVKNADNMLARGKAVPLIAARIGVSETTVHRLLGSNKSLQRARTMAIAMARRQAARRAFARACKANPNWPLSAIRSLPDNSYMWLRRHDRPWLDKKLLELGRAPRRRLSTRH